MKKIMYDEQGLKPNSKYKVGQWKKIAIHSNYEIKGFFGDYRFLSNFWPALVFLDGQKYLSVENAYHAAKYSEKHRVYLSQCSAKESCVYSRENPSDIYSDEEWGKIKYDIMMDLVTQKFDIDLNPELFLKLKETNNCFLEEANYWNDTFWGVHKTSSSEKGVGENNLGKILMEVRK